jgi:quinol---cytochrome c reductase iron-sulfur subunit, bacillus type
MQSQAPSEANRPNSQPPAAGEPRRGFVAKISAVVIAGFVGIIPAAVGLATFLNPLRSKVKERQRPSGSDAEGYYRVTTFDSLSAIPQAFKVIADRKDAWNTYPKDAIGAVYLQKVGAREVRAFNVSCPHAGCAVDWRATRETYHCPCHNSSFAADGTRDPKSPSARDLDSLDVRVDEGVVFVKFQDFKAGEKEKKPA